MNATNRGVETSRRDVVVIGGGPAGLAAAIAAKGAFWANPHASLWGFMMLSQVQRSTPT